MKWRVVVELAGADGAVQTHEISVGGCGTIDFGGKAGADAGGRQEDLGRAATPSGSGADRGALPQSATLPALRVSTSAEGYAPSAGWRRCLASWRFVHPVSVPAGAVWRRAGPSPLPRRSCRIAARRSMSAPSPRWAPCCRTAAPARCSKSSSRSGAPRKSRRSVSGRCASAPDWSATPRHCQGRPRPKRGRSRSPSTGVT